MAADSPADADSDSTELEALARHFLLAAETFGTSPLYQALCPVVAEERELLALLTRRRPGQQASFLLFGAVHYLLLDGAEHPLRAYYASIASDPAEPSQAGAAFIDFCREYRAPLEDLIRTRLVQSNVIRRAIALRYALWAIGRRCDGPVHLVEVGASAGLLMNADKYRYVIGDRHFGPPDAPVVLDSQWRGSGNGSGTAALPAADCARIPDLDAVPPIASKIGVDLHPIDLSDARERLWLRALMWPEQHAAAALLQAAIEQVREHPLNVIAGDVVDVCPKLAADLPAGEPRVIFHAATRMHVPEHRREAFDAAIDSLGASGPLYHAWLEPHDIPHHGYPVDTPGVVAMHGPGDENATALIRVDGHLHWMSPLG
jgi:hypothetical protein